MSLIQQRIIRSYSCRQGRLTQAQENALSNLLPLYGLKNDLSNEQLLNSETQFKGIYLEIGFGNGAALIELASTHPECLFIGVEIHSPGVGHILLKAHKQQLENLLVFHGDCYQLMSLIKKRLQFNGLFIWFPDPWPKRKHHKRRLIKTLFLDQVKTFLKKDAYFHLATDWQPYANSMRTTLTNHAEFCLTQPANIKNFLNRPKSKYEQRGLRLGHQVTDLLYNFQPESLLSR